MDNPPTRTLAEEGSTERQHERDPANIGRGTTVGRYVVLERLGSGGMGVVFAAYDPELDRKVALKLLKSNPKDPDSSRGTTRLLREAQALARLEHPNVVAVHDVGTFEGAVFVAMTFVEGQTLHEWMREEHGLEEVLSVMRAAGRGLAAAHAKGLIHRDFKPDNVMIDGDGRPLVMDFGLVRAVGERPESAETDIEMISGTSVLSSDVTRAGAIIGTPAYMSPEQFMGLGTDARSDEFSFCVTLYEALYGKRPFSGRTLAELGRAVTGGTVDPAPGGRVVPGWVHAVALRGLQVSPEDRFAGMDALLAALEPPVERRRSPWPAVAIVALLLAGGVGTWAYSSGGDVDPCAAPPGELEGSWDDARRAAVEAAYLGTDLPYAANAYGRTRAQLDEYASRWSQQRRIACVDTMVERRHTSEVMDSRLACLHRRERELRALTETLAKADETTIDRAGIAISKLRQPERCADLEYIRARVEPPPADTEAEVEAIRESLARARALADGGHGEDGLTLAREVQDRADALGYGPLQAEARLLLGLQLDRNGKAEEAVETLEQAFFEARVHDHDEVAARAAGLVAQTAGDDLNRTEDGLAWMRHARAELRRHPDVHEEGRLRAIHGLILMRAGRTSEAVDALREAVAMLEQPPVDDFYLAQALSSLGSALQQHGKTEEAIPANRGALDIWETMLGPDHPHVGAGLHNLGNIFAAQGHPDRAIPLHERAVEIFSARYGEDHPNTATALDSLASDHSEAGNDGRALELHEKTLAIRRRTLGADHPDIGMSLQNVGNSYAAVGEGDKAVAHYEEALRIFLDALGPDHYLTAYPHDGLAKALVKRGDLEQARAHADAAYQARQSQDTDPADLWISTVTLAEVRFAQGEVDEAVALVEGIRAPLDAGGDATKQERARVEALLAKVASQRR